MLINFNDTNCINAQLTYTHATYAYTHTQTYIQWVRKVFRPP